LYHIPQFTGVPISHGVVKALHEEFPATVVGLKESEGNLAYAKQLITAFPNFKVFVGNERQIIEAVCAGGAGTICGVANVYPELVCSLFHSAKKSQSATNPEQLDKFFSAMGRLNFVAAFKAIMEKRHGELWKVVRPPLVPLDLIDATNFLEGLKQAKLEL